MSEVRCGRGANPTALTAQLHPPQQNYNAEREPLGALRMPTTQVLGLSDSGDRKKLMNQNVCVAGTRKCRVRRLQRRAGDDGAGSARAAGAGPRRGAAAAGLPGAAAPAAGGSGEPDGGRQPASTVAGPGRRGRLLPRGPLPAVSAAGGLAVW